MRIAILSCFYPFRGGIAQFNASLKDALGKDHDVKAFNFTRQYPSLLFPGKTQYVTVNDDAIPVESEAVLDTMLPHTWFKTARKIREWGADLVVLRYWMSWFAPSLGWVERHVGCKVVAILDNVIPHERHFFDPPLTRYFLKGADGFITLCDAVADELKSFLPEARYEVHPHPLYSHFGAPLTREEAAEGLGIDPGMKTLLFFGLIREYKGLDILLEAFRDLPEDYQLVIAGEPYGGFDKYRRIIDRMRGKERVHLYLNYIRDVEVKQYFSAADVVVLPYRSATQSGISSISYHFEVPMTTTDVGGLREMIGDSGTGIVTSDVSAEGIRKEILRYFADPSLREGCVRAIRSEKDRLSWDRFAECLTAFAKTL